MQVAVQSKLQVNTQPCPLVVDLDGTLINGDLLVECLISAFNDRPRTILSSFLRTGWNKAAITAELAHSPDFDPHYLPYDDQVLSLIRAARAEGRRGTEEHTSGLPSLMRTPFP